MTQEQKQLPALAPSGGFAIQSIPDAEKMANLFIKSGLFKPSKKEQENNVTEEQKLAVATVKIMIGAQLGLSPHAAMAGLHVMNGKIEAGYQVTLAKVRQTPGYDYKILCSDNEKAEIEFFRNGVSLGISKFDTTDMQRQGGGDMWVKYPRIMRLARAATAGVDTYCPEVMGGPAFMPDGWSEEQELPPANIKDVTPPAKAEGKPKTSASGATEKQTSKGTSASVTASATDPKSSTVDTKTSTQPAPTAGDGNQEAATGTTGTADVQDAEIVDDRPPLEAFGEVLEAAEKNGWTEEQLQIEFVAYLSNNGVDCSDQDKMLATWTHDHVNHFKEYVVTHDPQPEG